MTGIVFGSTIKRANEKLEEIIKNYHIEPVSIVNTKDGIKASFKNGDYWIAVSANKNSRGHCANIGYIDRELPIEVVNAVCLPCIKAFPWTGVQYFG